MTDLQHWTSCEVHGHNYKTDEDSPQVRRCTDCGDTVTDDPWEHDYPGQGEPQDTDRPEDDPTPVHECEGADCGGRRH